MAAAPWAILLSKQCPLASSPRRNHHVDFEKPAILLVHGFLTTRNFRTVFNLSR